MGARCGYREYAERRSRVPTLFVMVHVNTAPEPCAGLDPHGMGGQHIAPGAAIGFACGKQRRYHRRRCVAEHGIGRVIEIERVRRSAIDERGIKTACAAARTEYQARSAARI